MKPLFPALVVLVALASCAPALPVVRVLYYSATESDPLDTKVMAIVQTRLEGQANVTFEILGSDAFEKRLHDGQFWNRPHEILSWTPSPTWSSIVTNQRVKKLDMTLPQAYLEDFIPDAVSSRNQRGGSLTVLPSSITITHVLYVNKPVLKSIGLSPATSYQELKDQIPVLKNRGLSPVLYAGRDPSVLASTLFPLILARLAGPDFPHKVATGRARLTDPDGLRAFSFFRTMVRDGVISFSAPTTDEQAARVFAQGKTPYLVGGDWLALLLSTNPRTGDSLLSNEEQEGIALSFFPALPGQSLFAPDTTMIQDGGFAMSSTIEDGTPLSVASNKVIQELQSKEVQEIRLSSHAGFSSRLDVVNSDADPLNKGLQDLYKTAHMSLSATAEFNGQFLLSLGQALREIAAENTTPERAAEELQALLSQK